MLQVSLTIFAYSQAYLTNQPLKSSVRSRLWKGPLGNQKQEATAGEHVEELRSWNIQCKKLAAGIRVRDGLMCTLDDATAAKAEQLGVIVEEEWEGAEDVHGHDDGSADLTRNA